MFAIEFCLVAVCCALAQVCPSLGDATFRRIENAAQRLAQRRALVVVAVGGLALGIRLVLLPLFPIPVPLVHDEYSHLLLADTLAHGRLANPTHPMWVHFETFHVNWHPTYASMYYPGYAVFLAFGQVVFGHPFWGVWLSGGLMCAAICWCLQGWVSPGWALVGSIIAMIRLATLSYWVDSYWGGTVSAIGGALALGALPRIKECQRVRDAVLMAVGMALLAWTRPYEGVFFCAPIIGALLWWGVREHKTQLRAFLIRVAVPTGGVLLVAIAMLGYYFYRVTGSPFTIPYKTNIQTYGLVFFPWEKLKPVMFHHQIFQDFYRGGPVVGVLDFAIHHQLKLQFLKAIVVWLFYFGPLLSMPLIIWLFTRQKGGFWRSFTPESRFILALIFVAYLSNALTIHIGQPHYAAPSAAAFYILILFAMRSIYDYAPSGRAVGRFIARSVPVLCLLLFLIRIAAPAFGIQPKPSWIRTWCSQDSQNFDRARILKELENTHGQQLVIVRYGPRHDFLLDEWVFNGADIDGGKVIWARDMGTDENEKLIQYFSGRRAWLVEPDNKPVTVEPYPGAR